MRRSIHPGNRLGLVPGRALEMLHRVTGRDVVNLITGYGPGYFLVGETRYEDHLAVTPEQVFPGWCSEPSEIAGAVLGLLEELRADVVLLGTGTCLVFPDATLGVELNARGTGLEAMSTDAACRTFNLLASEGRAVAALMLKLGP